jgi:hypothetical protein
MPGQVINIATADNWSGFRPGMTRTQVLELLEKQLSHATKHSESNFSADVDGRNIDFWFATDGSDRLRQISLEDRIVWNGRAMVDVTLNALLCALEPLGQAPMWEASDATDEPFPEPEAVPVGPVPDAELLEDGTVWLPDRRLGFVIWQGKVLDVVWRTPQDMPVRFAGPVTAAQRQLSLQPPPAEHHAAEPKATVRVTTYRAPLSQTALIWICLALLAFIGREGFQETQRWAKARILTGKFVSMEQLPRKKLFDLGPEGVRRLMPDDATQTRDLYHIAYLDPGGHPQSVTLEGADFYVPPRGPGEEVPVAYLAGDPPRVKGVARVRDVAFLEYLPWAIAVGVFYLIGLVVVQYLPRWWRWIVKLAVPKGGGADRDHPELR